MGKGDKYRPVDREKYERNWLRLYGKKCSVCDGAGAVTHPVVSNKTSHSLRVVETTCKACEGIGYVEKSTRKFVKGTSDS